MRIALTVGHSLLKNGCYTSADGRKKGGCLEYSWCKAFSKQVKSALDRKGHKVDLIICPEKKFSSSGQERSYKLSLINSKKYDLLVELHLNASDNPKANGTEVLYKTDYGKKYAASVEKELSKVFKSRGAKQTDKLYILNCTKSVAILIETFFCTSPDDYKKAKGLEKRTKIAKLVADGIDSV
ncbi:MAG: N-acetylmuramoyl-L-alanine amidase [Acetivibrio ethanolgignens]